MGAGTKPEIKRSGGGLWDPGFPPAPSIFPFFYGWVILAVSILGMVASMPGQTIGVSVFTTRLEGALGMDSLQMSLAYMLGTLVSALFLGRGGRFFDLVGARQALVVSTLALGLVLLALSACDTVAGWLTAAGFFPGRPWVAGFVVISAGFCLLRFTGQGMVMLSSRAMLGKWFERKRGLTAAVSAVFVSFFFAASPVLLETLIRMFGWKGAWQLMGLFFVFVFTGLFWALARDNPEECGLVMDGGPGPPGRKTYEDTVVHRDLTREEAARTYAFWAFTLVLGTQGLVATGYAFHILAIGAELGVSTEFILGLFLPMAGVSVASSLILGWLADRTRLKYLLSLMAAACMVAYAALALGEFPQHAGFLVAGFGVAGGCFGTISSVVWPRFYGRRHVGAVSGLFMTVIVLASAVGPIFFSLAERYFGAYRGGFALATVAGAVLLVGSLRADNPQRRLAPGALPPGDGR